MGLPKRKHPRLKECDYSQPGYYFVTINTENNEPLLSRVGRGLAPAAAADFTDAQIYLSRTGIVAREQLLLLEARFDSVKIDKYVIMPTHIHAIIQLTEEAAGASPRPTLADLVCTYKSLTTRLCNAEDHSPGRKIFQTSFYERVIRNEQEYLEIWRYIDENPLKWAEKTSRQ